MIATSCKARRADSESYSESPRVITDVPGRPGGFWGSHTHLVQIRFDKAVLLRWLGKRWAERVYGLLLAVKLLLCRSRFDAVVTGGGPCGMFFAWLQALVPWGRRPHVMVDCNWYVPRSRLRHWLKRLEVQAAAAVVDTFVVWASHEVEDYARAFNVGRHKFRYVPFHSTLDYYTYDLRDEGYLFAGGNYDRDFLTLVRAVTDCPVPTLIATTRRRELLGDTEVPEHVRIQGTTHEGFRQAMAAARLVVVPMANGLLHSGGQQTCLNAMVMGKPTIAVGRRWATDLIRHGDTGLIVDYEDVEGLRQAIQWVLNNPGEAQQMAARGQQHAAHFSTRRCMETIYRLALGA